MNKVKQILLPTLSLFLICFVTALLLSLTNHVTVDRIAELQRKAAEETRKQVLSSASVFEEETLEDGTAYYIGKDADGNTIGYVFTTAKSGYGGPVTVMSGFDADGVITGVKVIDCSETAGLGLKAKEDWFTDRYTGKTGALKVAKNAANAEDEILAITGATVTSTAVTDAVNQARVYFETITDQATGGAN